MSIDKDAVIQAVVKQHGILLGKDDPILTFLAVHDVVLGEYLEKINQADESHKEHLEEITDRLTRQSKELAETIVGSAVKQIQKEGEAIQENLRAMLDIERKKHQEMIQQKTAEAEASSKRASASMWVALGFSAISVISAAIIVAAF